MTGPLNSYPINVERLFGEFDKDCTARFQFTNGTIKVLESKFPGRSAFRADGPTTVEVEDVFVAPGSGSNTPEDIVYLDSVVFAILNRVVADFEGWSPNGAYLRVTGKGSGNTGTTTVRVTDFPANTVNPLYGAVNTAGLDLPTTKLVYSNSLDQPDTLGA